MPASARHRSNLAGSRAAASPTTRKFDPAAIQTEMIKLERDWADAAENAQCGGGQAPAGRRRRRLSIPTAQPRRRRMKCEPSIRRDHDGIVGHSGSESYGARCRLGFHHRTQHYSRTARKRSRARRKLSTSVASIVFSTSTLDAMASGKLSHHRRQRSRSEFAATDAQIK